MVHTQMKLSFIVPVYNVASYLQKCVDSLIAQDYSDYEIILVDDGSTDESPQICELYATEARQYNDQLPSIKVIHQPNCGLSVARNAGLSIAQGDYVCFVDSDDYWEKNVLSELMTQIDKEHLDVLRFDYQNVRINNEGLYEAFQPYKFPHRVDIRHDVVDGETYMDERMGYTCYAWQFVINHELTSTFMPGIHFEDTEWLPRMMLKAKRVNSTSRVIYNYFIREGSITHVQGNRAKVKRNVDNCLDVIKQYNLYIEHYPNCRWLKNMRSNMTVSIIALVAQHLYDERRYYISRLNDLKVFPLTIADQGRTYVHKARLINISPLLTIDLLYFKNILIK